MEAAQRRATGAWRAFTSATTAEAFYRGWLAVQSRLIADVAGGGAFGVKPAGQPASPIATCGERPGVLPALTVAARQALAQRRRVIVKRAGETGQRWSVAFPVQAQGQVVGVVALDLGPRSEPA